MATRRRSSKRRARPRSTPATSGPSARGQRHAVVLVLGDVGRSPRMQYHALSLARADPALRVSLAGYAGEACTPELYEQENLQFLTFAPRATRPLPVKVVVQFLQLLWLLLVSAGRVDLVLLQNPPTYGCLGSAGWTSNPRAERLVDAASRRSWPCGCAAASRGPSSSSTGTTSATASSRCRSARATRSSRRVLRRLGCWVGQDADTDGDERL